MSLKYRNEETIDDPKKAILNLTKILPVTESSILNTEICPFFLLSIEKKDIQKSFPLPFNINNSDTLGPFIESEYNKDGDSYRSPWSNKFFPPKESDKLLPNELRELEERLNKIIKLYIKLYYSEDAISSAYVSFQDESISNGFTCCVFIKSKIVNSEYLKHTSFLESSNIISIKFIRERSNDPNKERNKIIYRTNTLFSFKLDLKELANCTYNGTLNTFSTKTTYTNNYLDYDKHLKYIGNSIEENERTLRLKIDQVYLEKNNYICKEIRTDEGQNGETNSKINNLKNIFTEFEKFATQRKMKAELNEKKSYN
jgi:capping protein beta